MVGGRVMGDPPTRTVMCIYAWNLFRARPCDSFYVIFIFDALNLIEFYAQQKKNPKIVFVIFVFNLILVSHTGI